METCPLHPQLREDINALRGDVTDTKVDIGEMKVRQELQILALDEIKVGIKELTSNGNKLKIEAAVEHAKISPVFWFFSVLFTVVTTGIVGVVVRHFWK